MTKHKPQLVVNIGTQTPFDLSRSLLSGDVYSEIEGYSITPTSFVSREFFLDAQLKTGDPTIDQNLCYVDTYRYQQIG